MRMYYLTELPKKYIHGQIYLKLEDDTSSRGWHLSFFYISDGCYLVITVVSTTAVHSQATRNTMPTKGIVLGQTVMKLESTILIMCTKAMFIGILMNAVDRSLDGFEA